MTKPRKPETNVGIQGTLTVGLYDKMQRRLREKGWLETPAIVKSGIVSGHVLEIGSGPGYLGLEWLSRTSNSTLTGLEISQDMVDQARRNAAEYRFSERATYVQGTGAKLPFPDASFDGVITASSLHEWDNPTETLQEIWRVLKPGGRLLVLDFRRDMSPLTKAFLWLVAKPRAMRAGLLTSIGAAYTADELSHLLPSPMAASCRVVGSTMGLSIVGTKFPVTEG
jgi:ubiquinone/menaquinone biosynthesis C-methylase UbiE